jgi:RND family efflux transporter MFP subunit
MKSAVFLLCLMVLVSGQAAENLVEAKVARQREVQSGFTRAHARVILSAEQAGRILNVNGDVGDSISEKEPFACLDDTYLNLELRSNQTERDLLKVDIDYFDKEVARYQSLAKSKSSSQSQLDTAVRNLRRSRAQLRTLIIQGDVLKERKQRLCIRAPLGWRVIKRYVEPGKWVNAGEPVVEVGDYRRLSASFALSTQEYQALMTQLESGLRVRLPELRLELPAKVIRVSPAFNDQSRKIHLELELSEGLTQFRGGLRVDLPLNIPSRAGAVLVPQRALKKRYEQYWLKRSDGTEIDVVYLGRSGTEEDGWVRVVSPDIQAGDQFLTQDD